MTNLEKEILKKVKDIQNLLKENNKLDYLTICICKDSVSFNNEYWKKNKRQDKIEVFQYNNDLIRNGGDYVKD